MSEDISFLKDDAVKVAQQLIGWQLCVKESDGSLTGGTIVETEAYRQDDLASHSNRGETPRTKVMFGPAGRTYVYFTYGMHWCMNIVTGKVGEGQAVLIRAILPEQGGDIMRNRRGNKPDNQLANGPAKVCQALGVTGQDSGAVINQSRLILLPPERDFNVSKTERIGISKDTHRLWRFVADL